MLRPKSSKLSMESYALAFSKSWPCRKIGQGQLKVIIWTIMIVLKYPMLHTKFQGHQSTGSGVEEFWRVLPYMGVVAIVVMWPGWTYFRSLSPRRPYMKIGPVAFEMFEIVILWESWVKGHTMTLTSSTHKSSCSHLDFLLPIFRPNLQNFQWNIMH